MGRFSNLEFNDPKKRIEEEALASPAEARDEHFYMRLADGHFQNARFENALRFYSRALEFNANLFPAWFGQVRMLVELGEYKEAKIWADKALELHRDHPELLAAKAVACARSGESDKALQFSDASMAQKGASPFVWLARGEALLAAGKANHDSCFLKADEQSGRDWFLRLSIGRICLFYEDFAKGMSWVRKSIEQDARHASPGTGSANANRPRRLGGAGLHRRVSWIGIRVREGRPPPDAEPRLFKRLSDWWNGRRRRGGQP